MKNATSKVQLVPQRCVMVSEVPNFFKIVPADTTIVMPGGNKFEGTHPTVVIDAAWFDAQTKKNNAEDCYELAHHSGDFCRLLLSGEAHIVFHDVTGVVATVETPERSESQTISAQISKLEKQKTKLEVELNDLKHRIDLLERAQCYVAVAETWELTGLVIEVLRGSQEPVTASDLHARLVGSAGDRVFDGIDDPLGAVEKVLRRLVDRTLVKTDGFDPEAGERFVYVGRTLKFNVTEDGHMQFKGRT
jgi:hypothetical protein